MKRVLHLLFAVLLVFICLSCKQNERTVILKILQTSDIHGAVYPYDFIEDKEKPTSLMQAYTYINKLRQNDSLGHNVLLLDNGDNLQGQPTVYYYNFIDTADMHILADIMNYMEYDATSVGNHDIEAGHAVYDRVRRQYNFPMLCANIIETSTGNPYFTPYKVFERDGIKIAVLGLITPHVPHWLPENLWSGMKFTDMVESAREWVDIIERNEKPDILIGLFHSGYDTVNKPMAENASVLVAQQVPGFDVVFIGHDHQARCEQIQDVNGNNVWLLNPANDVKFLSEVTFIIKKSGDKIKSKQIGAELIDVSTMDINADLLRFNKQFDKIQQFVSKPIGRFTKTISTRDAYFGSSAFVDLIHRIQLDVAKADISFAAPLSFDTQINEGEVYVRDMFKLYKFENMLYAMELSGQEVKDFLEFSYSIWVNQMKSPDDHLLLLHTGDSTSMRNGRFINPTYNFDSAAGIYYEVDVTKSVGSRVKILRMANGEPFDLTKKYRVALNSYRGNGGGDHLTEGAGISKDELTNRIVFATDVDLRYYLMQWIEQEKVINPQPLNQWKFVPENWVAPAAKRDYELIFGNK